MDKFAVNSAAERIEYWLKIDPELFAKVTDTISDLQNVLVKIQNLLEDEACRPTEEAAEIKQAANEIEDVFDMLVYNVRLSVQNSFGIAKIGAYMFNILSPDIFRIKIEAIRQRLEDAVVMLERKALKGIDHLNGYTYTHEGRSKYFDDEYIVGLEGDLEKIIHQLTTINGNVHDSPFLFFIVGCPSSGKTTLAKQLYNHTLVRQHFHNFVWFRQSRRYLHNLDDFQHQIFTDITGDYRAYKSIETWTKDIGKCLIILDEIPCNLKETLQSLMQAFPTGLNGTKIIITGSSEEYDIFKTDLRCYFHQVKGKLDEERGWDLLCHLAFNKQNTTIPEMLEKKMLRICEGQPLTIKLLSAILSTNQIESLDDIQNSLNNQTMNHAKDVYELSYAVLPYYSKVCLLYLVMFPPKYEIHAGVYRRMWIAEGFGSNSSEEEIMENLEELSRRYLIQVVKRNLEGKIKIFLVPNLVYEFCVTKAREENFLDINSHPFDTSFINSRKVIIHSRWYKKSEDSYIKSFSLFQYQGMEDNRMRFQTICKDLKLLKVLNLCGVFISNKTLPDEIGKLVLLHYLGIRDTNIEVLPQSTGNLKNLFTLDWRDVDPIMRYGGPKISPNELWELDQLRHLYIPTRSLDMDKFKLLTLSNLRTLWGLRVTGWLEDDIQIRNFPYLQKLYIFNIYTKHQLDMIFGCLKNSPNLRKLKLECNIFSSKPAKLQHFDQLCEYFCQLSVLILDGPIKENVVLRFPATLVELELEESCITAQDPVPIIGNCCPKLKVLRLKNNAYLGTEMRFCAGTFQSLVELVLGGMYELETWVIETGALPRLEKLFLKCRTKLERLPEGIRFITTLRELVLDFMPRSFCEKLVHVEQDYLTSVVDKIKGEDFYLIQHVPDIRFTEIWDKRKEF
ncbi:unnamed protein product [Amaranthus hypochondriacus]